MAKLSPDGSTLLYATFLGGNGTDIGWRIAVDAAGNAFVTGDTSSSDFPATAGAFDTTYYNGGDAFVVKLSPDGSSLLYATFLGGSSGDRGFGIALDGGGNAFVTGWTSSSDFPTTDGAFDVTFNGGRFYGGGDAFVVKLSSDGSRLLYATFLGGNSEDAVSGIAVDANGNAFVTGWTSSSDFPTTPGALEASFNGGDSDAFVAKLSPDGSRLLYATFLGGSGWERGSTWGGKIGIILDMAGNVFVTGETSSPDFPTTTGAFDTSFNGHSDAFMAKLSPDGLRLLYATFLGGSGEDSGSGIAVDAAGNAYVTGTTWSSDFPTTPGAFDTSFNATPPPLYQPDAFIAKIPVTDVDTNPGTLQFSAVAYSAYENGSAVITVTRRNGRDGEVTVDFATSDGTAIGGSDYTPTSGTLTFANGETSKSFTIPIIANTMLEGNETVNLTLSNVRGGATLGVWNTAELTIIEAGILQFSAVTYSAVENGTVIITVTRTGGRSGEVTVDFATSDGTAIADSDYTPISGTLTLADGETSKTFTVPILDDTAVEGDETVNLTLSNPTGGSTLGSPSAAVMTIRNVDVNLADYFPATPGDMWTYQKNGALTVTTKVLPEMVSVNEVETRVFQDSDDGSKDFYTNDAEGIRLHRLFMTKVLIEGLGRVNITLTFVPPIRMTDRMMETGQTVTSDGVIRTNRLRDRVFEFPYNASFTVQGFDNVTVPAGNFDVVRLQGTLTVLGEPESHTFDMARKIGVVKQTTTASGSTKTLELTATNVGAHDLAVTQITAPKKITLKAGDPPKTAMVKVELQNRSPHSETIQDLATLGKLVTLTVEQWGAGFPCSPAPTLLLRSVSPQKPLPLTLKSKQKLTVAFEVAFGCANDPLASSAHDPDHWDYRYSARVDHAALDGEADTHPADDGCPRAGVVEPNPDGTIQDKGCGNKKPDGTLGADVLTDIVVK
ncbi:MAG: SBBP repeat-containing protein [Candidatus Tectomicrobia bacterium]|uniref:SBBP repeat-containing protein n=1 Tax=Tectimicrobiota bacterium TaxID=2528274 RepID=A0A932CQ66_UNCTE|nr:SBBP repeat-containing protein [Candidatus Tectomicrobia bacterium]